MNELTPTNDRAPMTPGIGVAGTVLCPFGFQKSPCLKNGCELWVELDYGGQKVGRCSLAWLSVLSTEVRASIDKITQVARPAEQPDVKEEETDGI